MGYLDSSPISLAGAVTQDSSPIQAANLKKRKMDESDTTAQVNALGLDYNNKENDFDYGLSSYFYPHQDSTPSFNFAYPNWWIPSTTAATTTVHTQQAQSTTPRAYNNSWYLLQSNEPNDHDDDVADRRSSTSSSCSGASVYSEDLHKVFDAPVSPVSPMSEANDPLVKAMQQSPINIPTETKRKLSKSTRKTAASSSPDDQPRKRGKLPKHVTETLRKWLMEHAGHPYPTEDEKKMLCSVTGLTLTQTANWFINARRRILVPAPCAGGVPQARKKSFSNASLSAQQAATAVTLTQQQPSPESSPGLNHHPHSDYHQMYNQQYQKLTQA